jgi:hypothetical protein
MSSCNCTSNIVIVNVDTVYDMSFMIWKCEMHIWTHGCLACVYDIKEISFKIHWVLVILHSDNLFGPKVAQIAGGMGATSCRVQCSSSERLSIKTHTDLFKQRPWALTSCIVCYCIDTVFQFRHLSVSKSAIFNPYTGTSVKGYYTYWWHNSIVTCQWF